MELFIEFSLLYRLRNSIEDEGMSSLASTHCYRG